MNNFLEYARYYDLLYADKNYKVEADYVDSLIRRYSARSNKNLLDIGCGTGGHALWFVKKGYAVTGLDSSRAMVSIARKRFSGEKRLEFSVQDAASFDLGRKFDIAVSLFHVMSYLTSNATLIGSLKNIHRHLRDRGLFIFDFWYGPAVITQRPKIRIKNLRSKEFMIKRTATPRINFNNDSVDIHYSLSIKSKKNNSVRRISEQHKLRYFFLPELYLALGIAGFKVVKCLKWLSFKEEVSEKSWSALIIAKK